MYCLWGSGANSCWAFLGLVMMFLDVNSQEHGGEEEEEEDDDDDDDDDDILRRITRVLELVWVP